MPRILYCNGLPVTGPIPIEVGRPVLIVLTLSDTDVVPGEKWTPLTTPPGGIVFAPAIGEVPAGATSPCHVVFTSTSGFTQPGNQQVKVEKIHVGAGVAAVVRAGSIDFQVTTAPAQPQPQPAPVVTPPQAQPTAAPATPTIPQPLQVHVTGPAAGGSGGNLVNGFSIVLIVACALAFASIAALIWALTNIMSVTSSSYVPGADGSPTQEGIVIENYDITMTAKPGGRIVSGEDPAALIMEMQKSAQTNPSP